MVNGQPFHFPQGRMLSLRHGSTSILADGKKQMAETWRKKMITAWVQATHVWSCISIWDIVLSVSLRESLHPLGKVSLLEVIILWVCLLFSSTSVLPAVRTEEESLWYVPFLREGKGHGAREWLSRILLKQLVISG